MNIQTLKINQMQKFKTTPRTNYLSLNDKVQDLTTEYLISLIKKFNKLTDQLVVMKELEKRIDTNEISEDLYFDTLENCTGI